MGKKRGRKRGRKEEGRIVSWEGKCRLVRKQWKEKRGNKEENRGKKKKKKKKKTDLPVKK